jgi:uncharacterized protein (TIGR02266 family)
MSTRSLLEAFEQLRARKRAGEALATGEEDRLVGLRAELEEVLFQRVAESGRERREHLRVPVAIQASYWSSDELKDRYVEVLGEGGLFLATDQPLPPGSRLVLDLHLVDRRFSFRVQAEVVSVHPGNNRTAAGLGVRFVDLTYDQKAVLYDLVGDRLRQSLLERRQYTRLDSRLQARFLWPEGSFVLQTADLGADGLFVATDHLLAPRERAKVLLMVPGYEDPVRAVVEVIRVIETPLPGLPAGLGLKFVMIDSSGRQAILEYMVGRVVKRFGPLDPHSELRGEPRIRRRIPIRFREAGVEGLTFSRDLSSSGLFLHAVQPPGLGVDLALTIHHPVSQQQLPLEGRVVRVVEADPAWPHRLPGVGVEYARLRDEQRTRLTEFLREFVLLEGEPGWSGPVGADPGQSTG